MRLSGRPINDSSGGTFGTILGRFGETSLPLQRFVLFESVKGEFEIFAGVPAVSKPPRTKALWKRLFLIFGTRTSVSNRGYTQVLNAG